MTPSRATLCALLVAGLAGCAVPVPQPPKLTIQVKGQARVEVQPPPPPQVDVQVGAHVDAQVEEPPADVVEPSYEPPAPVPLQGAEVVEFFGIPLDGADDIVFVLDRSGSMRELAQGAIAAIALPPTDPSAPAPAAPVALGPQKIDIARAELAAALEGLPSGTRMNLLYFNNRLEALDASIRPMGDEQRDEAIVFAQQTVPFGTTALAPAMRTAFLLRAKRIVLLSDGLGNVGGDAAAVLRDAREAIRGGVRIDTIGLGVNQDVWLLRSLAEESGGIYQGL